MSRIKSAWEIALERAGAMEVPPEELQKQREEKCRLAGAAIADKFLGIFDLKQLQDDLEKQPGEDKGLVAKAVVRRLVSALELGDYEKMEKIMAGIALVGDNQKSNETKAKLYLLYDSYRDVLRKKEQEIDAAGRKILGRLGISGEAVQMINADINKEWAKALQAASRPYEKEFALYKEELLQ
ncbi:MAG: hypothetical protein AB1523_00670 [Bacillota bacterium]